MKLAILSARRTHESRRPASLAPRVVQKLAGELPGPRIVAFEHAEQNRHAPDALSPGGAAMEQVVERCAGLDVHKKRWRSVCREHTPILQHMTLPPGSRVPPPRTAQTTAVSSRFSVGQRSAGSPCSPTSRSSSPLVRHRSSRIRHEASILAHLAQPMTGHILSDRRASRVGPCFEVGRVRMRRQPLWLFMGLLLLWATQATRQARVPTPFN